MTSLNLPLLLEFWFLVNKLPIRCGSLGSVDNSQNTTPTADIHFLREPSIVPGKQELGDDI